MKALRLLFSASGLGQLDRSIGKLKEIRDSYREMNVHIYGEELAKILNDW